LKRPFGITALSLFFAAGAAIAFTSAISLAFRGTPLDAMWRLNPRAYDKLLGLGSWAALLMLVISMNCAAAALGLRRGKRSGRVLAIVLLAINLVGDALNALLGSEPRALVGIPIAGALMAYLFTPRARSYFR
jgi:hypothetical protein